ncbi:TIGR02757 family protein [Helicobacter sp. 11S02629-2]|uniref:TIGR02757 family protein n=1 Tax=Helicobacter sp. 11S02629-2 TaxID=1476195 RepID=UPI000BA72C5C|nr:TIGR02757 family protein [Helicobacter sp. 11S02629-2]PAF44062.1 TIGR02757 family protein [Helicobacter sp. 11S02629-2]
MDLESIKLKDFLDKQYEGFNKDFDENSYADPLIFVKKHLEFKHLDELAFIAALFSYGNAKQILKFLHTLPFEVLESKTLDFSNVTFPYYRFQTSKDVKDLFSIMCLLIKEGGLKKVFVTNYKKVDLLEAIYTTLQTLSDLGKKLDIDVEKSHGLSFLLAGKRGVSPLKRINMFLRWMVRKDNLDLYRWKEVDRKDLLLPLDVHTFNISKKLKLLESKSYNLKACLEISAKLATFDPSDPIKYDFALYRIGQLKLLN